VKPLLNAMQIDLHINLAGKLSTKLWGCQNYCMSYCTNTSCALSRTDRL